mmetsp:Transcript_5053/g.6544  ORF Transcript_5053/g.6544 Transcript_5053/m.6544 type:complete len:379 (-) Transcript_5053:145-1281(-)
MFGSTRKLIILDHLLLRTRKLHTGKAGNEALLVLLRHGESLWNSENRFTGWCDVHLTEDGEEEAIEAGTVLASRGHSFDVAFTSTLHRASHSLDLAMSKINEGNTIDTEIIRSWRLNERHYGSLQGRVKDDPKLIKFYGLENILEWRRSFTARPPPMDETHPFYQPPPAPTTESLEDCLSRTSDFYEENIKPRLLAGQKVLVVAHANSIRALVKEVDDISDEDIRDLRIPNSIPLLYRLHPETLEPVAESDEWGFQGEYLTSWERVNTTVRAVERSQRRVLQALFRALDENSDGFITGIEFQKWAMSNMSNISGQTIPQQHTHQSETNDPKMPPRVLEELFQKWGLAHLDRKIAFEEFLTLSSEFWDCKDHFRMMKLH